MESNRYPPVTYVDLGSDAITGMNSPVNPISRADILALQEQTKEQYEEEQRQKKEKERRKRLEWIQSKKREYTNTLLGFLKNPKNLRKKECVLDIILRWPYECWTDNEFVNQFLDELKPVFPDCNVDIVYLREKSDEYGALREYTYPLEDPYDKSLLHENRRLGIRVQWE